MRTKSRTSSDRPTQFRSISARGTRLLARQEGNDVEFKRSLADLDTEDLVAFANSRDGGAILVGVEEAKRPKKKPIVVGCSTDDRHRVSILNRSQSCVPPIDIEIIIENSSRKPFLRIEIPSGPQKPYSTQGGTYKTRGDGRNIALQPGHLLNMFLQSEASSFIDRFRAATGELAKQLHQLEETIQHVWGAVEEAAGESAEATATATDAVSFAQEAASNIDTTLAYLEGLSEKVDAVLSHFQIDNPDDERAAAWMQELEEMFRKLPRKGRGAA